MAESPKKVYQVAALVFDGADILDICGPLCFLSDTLYNSDINNPEPAFKIHLIGDGPNVGIGAIPLNLKVEMNYQEALEHLTSFDILVVPGGPTRVIRRIIDEPGSSVLGFIKSFCTLRREKVDDPPILFSVCTGGLLLAAAGALTGISATTHHLCLEDLRKIDGTVNVISSVDDKDQATRYVDGGLNKDGIHVVTAGGVTCGLDGSLFVAELKVGRGPAEMTAKINEYQWKRA